MLGPIFVCFLAGSCLLSGDLNQVGSPAERSSEPQLQRFERTEIHMGTSFSVVLYAADEPHATRALDAAFARIQSLDKTLSDYDEQSELSRLSARSPTRAPVRVSDDLWRALSRSVEFSRATDGAFDITLGQLTRLWRRSRRQKQLPTPERLAAALAASGYQHLRLHSDSQSVELLRPNMRLDAGGIGQGLAADEALEALRKAGVTRAIINASGDLRAGDPPPGQTGWKVGIAPLDPQSPPSRFLEIANSAVSTSGDAFQFVEIDGRRYAHIVDPKTGLGLSTRMSVTIAASDCTTADALATAVCVLGPERGLAFVESQPGLGAYLVYLDESGSAAVRTSSRFDAFDLSRVAAMSIPPTQPALERKTGVRRRPVRRLPLFHSR